MSELKNHIAHFWAFNNSSVENAKSMLYYLVFMFYLLLIIIATTDAMILIPSSTVKLPILSIHIPLWEFYLIIPLLVVILHFNLLYNLIQHSKKLHCYQALENDLDSLTVFPLVINFVLTNKRTPNSLLLRLVMWLLIFAFPLILLCMIQWQFSAYHSISMTLWHFTAIVLDALVLVFTWHKIFDPPLQDKNDVFAEKNQTPTQSTKGKKVKHARLGALKSIFKESKFSWQALAFVSFAFFNLFILFIFKTTDGQGVKHLMPHLEVHHQVLIKSRPSDEIIQRFIALGKSKEEAYCEYARGIDLSGRDLRFCDFSGAYLVNVNLRNANLRGANFSKSDVHGGMFTGADLQNVNFHYTKMHYVTLDGNNLRKAKLEGLDLQNAQLSALDLSGLKLNTFMFEGAAFNKMNFESSDLEGVQLTGAIFTECFMKGSKLARAILNGVDFRSKNNLEGADLNNVQMKGANLSGARLDGANLSNVALEGAVWIRDSLQGVNLKNASLQGANIAINVFSGNFLAGVKVKGLAAKDLVGSKNYYYGVDATQTAYWKSLEKKLKKYNTNGHLDIHTHTIKETIENRILLAKQRLRKTDTVAYQQYFGISSGDAFIQERKKIACQNTYIAEGILQQQPFKETKENERVQQELIDYLRNNCAHIYDKIVKRGKVKVN